MPVPQEGRSAKPNGLKAPCEQAEFPPTGPRLQRLEPSIPDVNPFFQQPARRHSRPIHVILWTILQALIGASFGCWMGMPPPVANIAKLDMLARFFRNSQRGTSLRIHDCRAYFILTANRVRVLRRLSPIRAYSVNLNLRVKVLDFVQFGGDQGDRNLTRGPDHSSLSVRPRNTWVKTSFSLTDWGSPWNATRPLSST